MQHIAPSIFQPSEDERDGAKGKSIFGNASEHSTIAWNSMPTLFLHPQSTTVVLIQDVNYYQ